MSRPDMGEREEAPAAVCFAFLLPAHDKDFSSLRYCIERGCAGCFEIFQSLSFDSPYIHERGCLILIVEVKQKRSISVP